MPNTSIPTTTEDLGELIFNRLREHLGGDSFQLLQGLPDGVSIDSYTRNSEESVVALTTPDDNFHIRITRRPF
jgi:hypothetical protein